MAEDRNWMYDSWSHNGAHSDEWVAKTTAFLNHAFSLSKTGKIRCPCRKHENFKFLDKTSVTKDLCRLGFMPGYEVWEHHGEASTMVAPEEDEDDDRAYVDRMDEMLEAIQPEFDLNSEDPPTPEVQMFFKLLKASEEPLHEHTKVTLLAFVTQLLAIKSKYFFSNNCYNDLLKLIGEVLPNPHKLPKDMYHSKVLVKDLGMGYEKIDVCRDNCMLFWKEYEKEEKCLKCGKSR